jgi:hypothetical protein
MTGFITGHGPLLSNFWSKELLPFIHVQPQPAPSAQQAWPGSDEAMLLHTATCLLALARGLVIDAAKLYGAHTSLPCE